MTALFILACGTAPDSIEMSARMVSDGDIEAPMADADVTVLDAAIEPFSDTSTDEDGNAKVDLPYGGTSFLVLSGEGYAPTSYALGAYFDDIEFLDGVLWGRTLGAMGSLVKTFAACPTLGVENGVPTGATVEGEVRFYLEGVEVEELPLVTTATVIAYDADGAVYPGCYLDDAGVGSEKATATGQTGRFAVFGVPSGPTTVLVTYEFAKGISPEVYYFIWLEEGGVAPFYPAFVFSPE